MSKPNVSIITPYFETGELFLDTVRSIINMNYESFEWIIVDDHSKRFPADRVLTNAFEKYPNFVKLIYLKENIGPNGARLVGVHKARGTYITFLDSDDIYFPDKLAVQIKYMQQNQLIMTHTDTVKFQKDRLSNTFVSGDVVDWKKYIFTRKFPVNTVAVDRKYFINKLKDGKKLATNLERSFPGEDMLIFEMLFWQKDKSYRINQTLSAYRNEASRSSNYLKNFIGILYFQFFILCSRRRYLLIPLIFVTILSAFMSRWKYRVR